MTQASPPLPTSRGALSGVRVIELGMVMQVPLAGQMLGDYGADVIKVERLSPGEILRTLDPVANEKGGISCYYAALCRNKRSLALDIKSEEGRDLLLRLIDSADVLLHNFRPGVMERLGLSFEDLEKRNPRLIYAVGYAFGATGPMAKMPGQDMLAQSYSGFAMSGVEESAVPQITNTPIIDYMTALSLTQGILAALVERSSSGRGQKIETSLLDVAFAAQVLEQSSIAMHSQRTSWVKQSMRFKTTDGWLVVLTLFRDNPLRGLCAAFDVLDFSGQPKFATRDLQVKNIAEIEEYFRPLVAEFSTAECVERLSGQDILCSPINTLEQAAASPQIRNNGMVWSVPVSGYGDVALAGNPVKLSRTPPELRISPAELGAHASEILGEIGVGEEEFSSLRQQGVVEGV